MFKNGKYGSWRMIGKVETDTWGLNDLKSALKLTRSTDRGLIASGEQIKATHCGEWGQ